MPPPSEALRSSGLRFYDLAGQQAWGLALSPEGEEGLDLGELSGPALPQGHACWPGPRTREPRSGLLKTAAGPMAGWSRTPSCSATARARHAAWWS